MDSISSDNQMLAGAWIALPFDAFTITALARGILLLMFSLDGLCRVLMLVQEALYA